MGLISAYRLRLRRQRLLWRAFRRRRELSSVTNRLASVDERNVLERWAKARGIALR